MNPFIDVVEKYESELERLEFDHKTMDEYRSNIGRMGMDLSIEDMTGMFYMKGKIEVLKDVIQKLYFINSMVEFEK